MYISYTHTDLYIMSTVEYTRHVPCSYFNRPHRWWVGVGKGTFWAGDESFNGFYCTSLAAFRESVIN